MGSTMYVQLRAYDSSPPLPQTVISLDKYGTTIPPLHSPASPPGPLLPHQYPSPLTLLPDKTPAWLWMRWTRVICSKLYHRYKGPSAYLTKRPFWIIALPSCILWSHTFSLGLHPLTLSTLWKEMGIVERKEAASGYNFKALPCTPSYLNAPIFQFLHINSYEI